MLLDSLFLFTSVILSVAFSKGIVKGLTERFSSVMETISVLNFSGKLKLSVTDPAANKMSQTFEELYEEMHINQQKIEKSVRCHFSTAVWIFSVGILMILLKEGKLVTETYHELFELILFLYLFVYIGYYSWSLFDTPFKQDKKNINTMSRHNLLIVISTFSIPFAVGNYNKWSIPVIFLCLTILYVLIWLFTKIYRAICVSRFEKDTSQTANSKKLSRLFYLSGANREAFIYFAVSIILFLSIDKLDINRILYDNLSITISVAKDFFIASSFFFLSPIVILLFRLFFIAPPKSIVNYFFSARPELNLKWNSTKE